MGFFHFLWRARSDVTARGLLKKSLGLLDGPVLVGVLDKVVLVLVVGYGYGVLLEKVDHQPATGPGRDVLEIDDDGPRLGLGLVLVLLSVILLGLALPVALFAVGSCGSADVR